jgi:putative copper resistance protein D
MNKRLRRILKGLGILISVLVVLVIGLVAYVQLTWDHPVSRAVPQMTAPTDPDTVARGEALYGVYCVVCHGAEGTGSPLATVPLKDAAQGMDDATLARFIAEGLPGTSMPGFGRTLTDEQIADLVAFIRTW